MEPAVQGHATNGNDAVMNGDSGDGGVDGVGNVAGMNGYGDASEAAADAAVGGNGGNGDEAAAHVAVGGNGGNAGTNGDGGPSKRMKKEAVVFDEEEYVTLRRHYMEPVVTANAELAMGQRLRRQTRPPRIQQEGPGWRDLRKRIRQLEKQGAREEIFSLLHELREWELRPPALGGSVPNALRTAGADTSGVTEVIDISDEATIIDVDSYIIEMLLVKVVKADLVGSAAPAASISTQVKAEDSCEAGLEHKQPQLWDPEVQFQLKERVELYQREAGTGTLIEGPWEWGLAKLSGTALKQAVIDELEKPPEPGFSHPVTRYSDSDGVWLGGSVTAVEPTLSVLLDDGRLVNGDDFPVMRLTNEAASAGVDVHKVFLSQWEHSVSGSVQFSYTKHPCGHFEWTGLKDGLYNGDDIIFCGVCTAMWHARPSGSGFWTAFTSTRDPAADGCEQCGSKAVPGGHQYRVLKSSGC